MKYAWIAIGVIATCILIHGIWANNLNLIGKIAIAGILIIDLVMYAMRNLESKK